MNHAIRSAYMFAHGAHSAMGQRRKYTGEDYIHHPVTVSWTVQRIDGTTDMVVAALLHDVLEDTGVELHTISNLFGPTVGRYVRDLTDEYTKDAYPDSNRAERKRMEAERYATTEAEVQTIKLADMLNNTMSIAQYDPTFLKTYGPEKRFLLGKLSKGHPLLWAEADMVLRTFGY